MKLKHISLICLIAGITTAIPHTASANMNGANMDGLIYALIFFLATGILIIVNLAIFVVNLSRKKTGRAITVIVLSAILLAICTFMCIYSLKNGDRDDSYGPTMLLLALAAAHLFMIHKSNTIIAANKSQNTPDTHE